MVTWWFFLLIQLLFAKGMRQFGKNFRRIKNELLPNKEIVSINLWHVFNTAGSHLPAVMLIYHYLIIMSSIVIIIELLMMSYVTHSIHCSLSLLSITITGRRLQLVSPLEILESNANNFTSECAEPWWRHVKQHQRENSVSSRMILCIV